MQTVFIINPAAGAGNDFRDLMSGIALLKEKAGEKVSVYETRGVGDAEMFVRKTLEEHPDDMLFVACGGDELDGIDYVMATKIFRKFESLNLSMLRDELKDLCTYLKKTFGSNSMKESIAYLERLQKLY